MLRQENRQVITSNPDSAIEHEISSPFFPTQYPRDYGTTLVLTCAVEACRVHLMFTDFQLSTSSTMEFFDTNGERFVVTGSVFRPPILISSGTKLTVRFKANNAADLGFKAIVKFIKPNEALDSNLKPHVGCGGLVQSVGGAITMMNMLKENDTETEINYDCIWLIRPRRGYMNLKSHLSIKVETFDKMSSDSEISIIQGTYSTGLLLERIEADPLESVSSNNLAVPFNLGIYVRLRGRFNTESRLAIVYTAFSYKSEYL